MSLTVVAVSIGKDSKGADVTECTPHAIALSLDEDETIAWGSFDGSIEVEIQRDDRPVPLLGQQPWKGAKGQISTKGSVSPTARPGLYIASVRLFLPNGTQIEPGGAIIIIKKK